MTKCVYAHLVRFGFGQSAVRLNGQTDQILPQSLLRPAQRHQGLGLTHVTLQ